MTDARVARERNLVEYERSKQLRRDLSEFSEDMATILVDIAKVHAIPKELREECFERFNEVRETVFKVQHYALSSEREMKDRIRDGVIE